MGVQRQAWEGPGSLSRTLGYILSGKKKLECWQQGRGHLFRFEFDGSFWQPLEDDGRGPGCGQGAWLEKL